MVKIKFIFLGIILISSCLGLIKTRVTMASKDVESSKKNGVFIAEYSPSINYIKSDSMDFQFHEIWLEYQWFYKNQLRQIEVEDNRSMLIRFTTNNYDYFWNQVVTELFKVNHDAISHGFTNVEDSRKLTFSLYKYPNTIHVTFFGDQEVEFVKKK